MRTIALLNSIPVFYNHVRLRKCNHSTKVAIFIIDFFIFCVIWSHRGLNSWTVSYNCDSGRNMGLAEEFFWELDNSWKDYTDVGFRTRVVRTMLPREGYEFGSWEEELLDALKESFDHPGSPSANVFSQQVLEGQQNGSFIAVSTLAMIFGNGRVAEEEHFAKSYEQMQKEIEEFFRSGFAEMEARKKALRKDEDDKPISLIKLKDYSGLKTYLKNHRKNPEAYPLDKRGHKDYNILHLAAKMMDERALKIMFDFSECDVLKSSLSDEDLSPLAVFVLNSEGKRRDLFNCMIRSGCNLLQCDTSIHDCPLMIIIERISQGKALYLKLLEVSVGADGIFRVILLKPDSRFLLCKPTGCTCIPKNPRKSSGSPL